eukprot:76974_1
MDTKKSIMIVLTFLAVTNAGHQFNMKLTQIGPKAVKCSWAKHPSATRNYLHLYTGTQAEFPGSVHSVNTSFPGTSSTEFIFRNDIIRTNGYYCHMMVHHK